MQNEETSQKKNLDFVIQEGEIIKPGENGKDEMIPDGALIKYKGHEKDVVIPDGVTYIESMVFFGYRKITSITIPNSVTTIKHGAFLNCENLTEMVIPDGVSVIEEYTFSDCTNLKNIVIPPSVTSIGKCAFSLCTSLESLLIPNGVTAIEEETFSKCKSLKTITIPNSVTIIKKSAFNECESLETIIIPSSVETIEENAFDKCIGLSNIIVEEGNKNYKSIDGNLYSKDGTILIQYAVNKKATSFVIPNHVTNISSGAFTRCAYLESITIHSGIQSIGEYALAECTNLKNILVEEGNKTYKSIDGSLYTKDATTLIQYAIGKEEQSFNIPEGVIIVGVSSFYGCTNLRQVIIPSSATLIKKNAFYSCINLSKVEFNSILILENYSFWQCTNLSKVYVYNHTIYNRLATFPLNCPDYVIPIASTPDEDFVIKDGVLIKYKGNDSEVIIPSDVTCIGDYSFKNCNSLRKVVIREGVTKIDKYAFWGCSNLESVLLGDEVSSIKEGAFKDCKKLSIINFPESVVIIEDEAFSGCELLNTEPPKEIFLLTLGKNAFYGTSTNYFQKQKEESEDLAKKAQEEYHNKNYKTAYDLANNAFELDSNNLIALDILGHCYYYGYGANKDETKAEELLLIAAEKGYAPCQCFLGQITKSIYWCEKAAEQDDVIAQVTLGELYLKRASDSKFRGHDIPLYYKKALELFRLASEKGNIDAKLNIAICYRKGYGVEIDHTKANNCFRFYAEQGIPKAQYLLGESYHCGYGFEQDFKEAAVWYRKAAKQGHQLAKRMLSQIED